MRASGRPLRQAVSPTFRNDTSTDALRLASPSICHSNPRLIRVGCSTTNSPGVTEVSEGAAATRSNRTPAEATSVTLIAAIARRIFIEVPQAERPHASCVGGDSRDVVRRIPEFAEDGGRVLAQSRRRQSIGRWRGSNRRVRCRSPVHVPYGPCHARPEGRTGPRAPA